VIGRKVGRIGKGESRGEAKVNEGEKPVVFATKLPPAVCKVTDAADLEYCLLADIVLIVNLSAP
jgi:hypothetical protein